mmetsp:Transcript_25436/g.70887  ORF Transcript_25436/g.70887 Transcript_25436/m.70887 type:complete len:273 (-) Transcript_25436:54-872(-)
MATAPREARAGSPAPECVGGRALRRSLRRGAGSRRWAADGSRARRRCAAAVAADPLLQAARKARRVRRRSDFNRPIESGLPAIAPTWHCGAACEAWSRGEKRLLAAVSRHDEDASTRPATFTVSPRSARPRSGDHNSNARHPRQGSTAPLSDPKRPAHRATSRRLETRCASPVSRSPPNPTSLHALSLQTRPLGRRSLLAAPRQAWLLRWRQAPPAAGTTAPTARMRRQRRLEPLAAGRALQCRLRRASGHGLAAGRCPTLRLCRGRRRRAG